MCIRRKYDISNICKPKNTFMALAILLLISFGSINKIIFCIISLYTVQTVNVPIFEISLVERLKNPKDSMVTYAEFLWMQVEKTPKERPVDEKGK